MARIIKETDNTDRTGDVSGTAIGPTAHHQVGASVVTKSSSGSPSVTAKLQGSMDGVTDWTDITGATATVTTDTTTNIVADVPQKWFPFYRWDLSAFTTITVDSITIWVSGFAAVDGD